LMRQESKHFTEKVKVRAMSIKPVVSIVIPAWNEAERIGLTLGSLREMCAERQEVKWGDLVVVDDGSTDGTSDEASRRADRVIRNARNIGKGGSLDIGWRAVAGSDIIMFLDADLGNSARHAAQLLGPVLQGTADMTVARIAKTGKSGGFGLAKGLARNGIYRLSGLYTYAPLSGQRAIRTEVLRDISPLADGFGVEVGLTIDAVRKGYRVVEVDIPFRHRETGRDWQGFSHRRRQFFAIGATLLRKWRRGTGWQ